MRLNGDFAVLCLLLSQPVVGLFIKKLSFQLIPRFLVQLIYVLYIYFTIFFTQNLSNKFKTKCLIFIFVFFITAVFIALVILTTWHGLLISGGETSIEAHINKYETERMAVLNFEYINVYNYGAKMNWILFLGLHSGR